MYVCVCMCVADMYGEDKDRDTTGIPEKGPRCPKIRESLGGSWKSGVWDEGNKREALMDITRYCKYPILLYFLGT